MKRELLDILACPIDKYPDLELYELNSKEEIIEGVIYCPQCSRFYPIIDAIPIMLPDELRDKEEDLRFLEKWKEKLPDKIINKARPWHI
ncbi:MAG: Trm112 family protein [Candidatus Nitrosocaldaceae archaeon]